MVTTTSSVLRIFIKYLHVKCTIACARTEKEDTEVLQMNMYRTLAQHCNITTSVLYKTTKPNSKQQKLVEGQYDIYQIRLCIFITSNSLYSLMIIFFFSEEGG